MHAVSYYLSKSSHETTRFQRMPQPAILEPCSVCMTKITWLVKPPRYCAVIGPSHDPPLPELHMAACSCCCCHYETRAHTPFVISKVGRVASINFVNGLLFYTHAIQCWTDSSTDGKIFAKNSLNSEKECRRSHPRLLQPLQPFIQW